MAGAVKHSFLRRARVAIPLEADAELVAPERSARHCFLRVRNLAGQNRLHSGASQPPPFPVPELRGAAVRPGKLGKQDAVTQIALSPFAAGPGKGARNPFARFTRTEQVARRRKKRFAVPQQERTVHGERAEIIRPVAQDIAYSIGPPAAAVPAVAERDRRPEGTDRSRRMGRKDASHGLLRRTLRGKRRAVAEEPRIDGFQPDADHARSSACAGSARNRASRRASTPTLEVRASSS